MLPAKHKFRNHGEVPRNCGFETFFQPHETESAKTLFFRSTEVCCWINVRYGAEDAAKFWFRKHSSSPCIRNYRAVYGVCFCVANVTGSEAPGEGQVGRQAWFAFVSLWWSMRVGDLCVPACGLGRKFHSRPAAGEDIKCSFQSGSACSTALHNVHVWTSAISMGGTQSSHCLLQDGARGLIIYCKYSNGLVGKTPSWDSLSHLKNQPFCFA